MIFLIFRGSSDLQGKKVKAARGHDLLTWRSELPRKIKTIKKTKKIKKICIYIAQTIVFIRFEALAHVKIMIFLRNFNDFASG